MLIERFYVLIFAKIHYLISIINSIRTKHNLTHTYMYDFIYMGVYTRMPHIDLQLVFEIFAAFMHVCMCVCVAEHFYVPLTSLCVCLFVLAPHVHIYICINNSGVTSTYLCMYA